MKTTAPILAAVVAFVLLALTIEGCLDQPVVFIDAMSHQPVGCDTPATGKLGVGTETCQTVLTGSYAPVYVTPGWTP
jgi:hypothetical protein